MAFTAGELANIANSVLDYHIKGKAESQIKQSRPLFDDLQSGQKYFPGGKDYITTPVKGVYTTGLAGYTHDDDVTYGNPANTKRAQAAWYEHHGGIKVTMTELKKAGISVVDSMRSERTSNHSEQELIELTNLLDEKIDDMMEGSYRSFAEILWRDGTQDAKALPGISSFISIATGNANATGTRFGIDSAANSWWRNRSTMGMSVSDASAQVVVQTLQKEMRQLRRYGTPKHKMYAGSDFLDWFEKELRAKGNYTLEGWAGRGKIDASVADVMFKGIELQYDPLLDDLSRSKYLYILDMNAIKLMPMTGEDWKTHTPARPPEKYVLYRAMTWTGGLIANRLNSSGVYSIA